MKYYQVFYTYTKNNELKTAVIPYCYHKEYIPYVLNSELRNLHKGAIVIIQTPVNEIIKESFDELVRQII